MQNALYWKELLEQFGQFREGNTGKVRVDATRAGPRFFMILRAELVKLNNEWRLARSVCAGGWNRVPSHFDVWRQPPIMESIIARHSLSFCVPFSLAKRHGSPFSQFRVEFIHSSPAAGPKGQQTLSLSWSRQRERRRFIPYRKKLLGRTESHGESIPRKVRPVQVKVHPRVQGYRYYRRIIYANYPQRVRVSRKQDPNCQYVLISFRSEPIDRAAA